MEVVLPPVPVTTPVEAACVALVVVVEDAVAPPVPVVLLLPPQAPGANASATRPPDKTIHGYFFM